MADCIHRWLLKPPKEGVVRGQCKDCSEPYVREEKEYREYGDAIHDVRAREAQAALRAQLPMYRPYK